MPASAVLRQHSRTFAFAAAAVPLVLAAVADDVRVRRQLHIARRDPLTGLPGRSVLMERVARLAHARRDLLHVLLADVDGLKSVNDSLGHATGDALIAEMGRRLSAWARPRGGLAARLGGDEFGVALLLPRGPAQREVRALRALLALPIPYEGTLQRDLEGQLVYPSVSIGIARATDLPDAASASRILRGADMGMHKVKTGTEPLGYMAPHHDAYAPAVHGRRPGRSGTHLPVG